MTTQSITIKRFPAFADVFIDPSVDLSFAAAEN